MDTTFSLETYMWLLNKKDKKNDNNKSKHDGRIFKLSWT